MSKGKLIGFWIFTVLVGLSQGASGVADLAGVEDLLLAMDALGYPRYVLNILGTFKILGAICLLAPGLKRAKEWAYAGFAFDFIGAAASHAMNGDGVDLIMPPLVLLTFLSISYVLRPDNRKLEGPAL